MNVFANSWGVYISLVVIPLFLVLLFFHSLKLKKRKEKWGGELLNHYTVFEKRNYTLLRISLLFIALISTLIAFSRPQWGEVEKKGVLSDLDVVILFDVSKSMNVKDVKPSRLERARMEIKSLFEKLEGARIGLVAFSSMPLILCPLTEDKGAVNMLFDIADTSLIPALGTDIGKGIEEALRLFSYDEERSKVLIVVSDGEDMGQSAFKGAGAAQTLSVKIFSLGIGTEKGGVVLNKNGDPVIDPDTGNPAVSSLDPRKLQHIANVTDGRYFEISRENQNINPLLEELMRIKKREYATKEREKREEKFAIFAAIALFAFIAAVIMPFKRKEIV